MNKYFIIILLVVSKTFVQAQSSLKKHFDTLKRETKQISIPYGETNKNTYAGVITEVKRQDFEQRPLTNLMNAVVGNASGIQTKIANSDLGSGAYAFFRGLSHFYDNRLPLIIVDGYPFKGELMNINTLDIEKISFLKDGLATALYGVNAQSGVIAITTKKAALREKKIDFQFSGGMIQNGLADYDKVDSKAYYELMWEAYRNTLQNFNVPRNIANQIATGTINSYNGRSYTSIKENLVYNPFNVPNDQIVDVNGRLNKNASLLYDDIWKDELY